MIIYRIHQIKDIGNTDYAFRGYDPEKFCFLDYDCKYEGEFEACEYKTDLEICEVIFHIFNMRRPEDFKGHSLSMSDIIELDIDGHRRLYYCDTCGWQRI